jgi:hypothetical protein
VRFLATLLIAVAILGAVGWAQFSMTHGIHIDPNRNVEHHGDDAAMAGDAFYSIEITPTFDAAKDPFAVQLTADSVEPILVVRCGGRVLLQRSQDVQRGVVIAVGPVKLPGDSAELSVDVSPAGDESLRACGLRLKVVRGDGALCDDQTLWTEGQGGVLSQTVQLSLKPRLQRLNRGGKSGAP